MDLRSFFFFFEDSESEEECIDDDSEVGSRSHMHIVTSLGGYVNPRERASRASRQGYSNEGKDEAN